MSSLTFNDQGVDRVTELENLLGEIIDLIDHGDLITADIDVEAIIERARTVLAQDTEFDPE